MLHYLGGTRLWAGHPPAVFGRLLAEEFPPCNLRTLGTLAWAAWGSVSPASLRLFLRSVIRTRDLLASLRVEDGRPYDWRSE